MEDVSKIQVAQNSLVRTRKGETGMSRRLWNGVILGNCFIILLKIFACFTTLFLVSFMF